MNTAVSRRGLLRGAVAAGGLLLSGCASAPGGTPAASPGTVSVAACGRTLTFAIPPQRVVSFYPAMTELLLALGLDERIAGQVNTNQSPPSPAYADRYARIKVLAEQEPSIEVLLAARPDLIVADAAYHFDGNQLPTLDELTAKGIPVYLNASFCDGRKTLAKVTDVDTDLAGLGRIFAAAGPAATLAEHAKATLADTTTRLAGRAAVPCALLTVYDKALYADAGGLYTDVLTLAGGRNVTDQAELPAGEYYAQISPETIARKNPDAIVYTYLDDAGRAGTLDYLRRTFPDTTAVRSGRLIATPEATFGGALRSVDGVVSLARQLHPAA
ncbi:ABC transporter substrate-binding protein [Dactylosporangium sp. NPDC005572]|uniref:ABC transporter substrate-binding protein n=1 Tax=Dactylosporangium sp. NPDC005572 TaxID=3156889 RepID=UPI0033A7F533